MYSSSPIYAMSSYFLILSVIFYYLQNLVNDTDVHAS